MTGTFLFGAIIFVSAAATTSAFIGGASRAFSLDSRKLAPAGRLGLLRLGMAAPLLLGFTLALAIVAPTALGYGDHCLAHGDHHVHLCWTHGAPQPPLVLSVVAGACLLFALVRVTSAVISLVRSGRALRALRATTDQEDGRWVIPASAPIAFTAGVLRPRVFVSRGLLDDGERWRAVLAHERAHARAGDPRWRWLMRVLGAFHLPVVGEALSRAHAEAQELAADAAAAEDIGDALRVAEALTEWVRLESSTVPLPFSVGFGEGSLRRRVLALTSSEAEGRRLSGIAWVGSTALLAPLAAAPDLHHAAETILGWLTH